MFPRNKSKRVGVQGDVPFLIINGKRGDPYFPISEDMQLQGHSPGKQM